MKNDSIIQELREIRKKNEEECEKKGQTYFEYLLEIHGKYKDRLVTDVLNLQGAEEKNA